MAIGRGRAACLGWWDLLNDLLSMTPQTVEKESLHREKVFDTLALG
jgi:hypothetical protein